MIDSLKTLLDWFVPPMDHNETTQYLWRVRIAIFGCLSFTAIAFFFVSMLFAWGPMIIQPASAQTVHQEVVAAKADLSKQITTVQSQISTLSANQYSDRVERLDQQLLWYRGQNCRAKTEQAKALFLSKLIELEERYSSITGKTWTVPSCADVGGP